jgi:polo-like kinase 1
MEMHKRRKTVTEPELRYFVRQIAGACHFLHSNKIVHRDLKLGNLFLNDGMELKVGDFGLATRFEGKRKMTLCGTPNYIAPEVLTKKGHAFEVDVWSLGCIVYTLLVGKPPFETSDLKDTYRKIRHNDYQIPDYVPLPAKNFIDKMLQADPSRRPTMEQILHDPYLTNNYVPSRLPTSCLTTSPRFDQHQGRLSLMPTEFVPSPRRALCPIDSNPPSPMAKLANNKQNGAIIRNPMRMAAGKPEVKPDYHLNELDAQLKSLVAKCTNLRRDAVNELCQDPASLPVFWISKWVDYTDKYGLGYQLCDNSIGVQFNDMTRMVLMADEKHVQYVEKTGEEIFIDVSEQNEALKKKVTLLRYYKNYMNEHLQKTGEKAKECDDIARLPYLANCFRTKNAIVFQMTNGTVQINFFEDHIKLILCPLMEAVTYVTPTRDFYTYKFNLLETHGCCRDLYLRLKYAAEIVGKLRTNSQQTLRASNRAK